ncbi:hypothetical protein [Cryobacterium adonitolivorans]|uniref:hypothetical protein n=1 Tax=Cryobacterium adonitolivorans TaxID=1259189 RepID=UPI00141A6752|nr:hypothetical protein [Cryobacterium adonitolivorans]
MTTAPCGSAANQQVQGSVVIPIFEIADSADEDSLDTLSIRGGTAGISITVTTPCVVAG